MKRLVLSFVTLGAAGLFAYPWMACIPGAPGVDIPMPEGGAGPDAIGPRGVGERCDDGSVCRPGLACTSGVCQPGRSSEQGTPCVISAECKDGLYCGPERTCAPAGAGEQGAQCGSDGDCKSGFRCNLVGFSAQCQPEGSSDVGGVCGKSGDCFGGLLCAEQVCVPPPPGIPPLGIPSFKGVACEDETGDVTAHFRVPRGQDDKDYFRLPYPNDIRLKSGRPDLAGFPTPGADLIGFDLVDRWARYLELTGTGYSVYPTITFRFSGEIDFDSMKQAGATRWADITPGAGNDIGHSWSGTTERTAYVCANGFGFRPATGRPLVPGHTYAVLINNTVKAKDGKAIVVSPDLTAVLGAADPGGALSAAWNAYAPLRVWAASKSVNLGGLVNAAVFTVGKTDDIAAKLAPAVTAAPAPTATGWVKCGAAPSPCAQATDGRACPAAEDPAFDELHALVTLPRFQSGNAPFLEPADGGDFVLDGSGQPTPQGSNEVCLALTVPKGTMPANGWPLVVYAHGTGGSFRSHINEGVSARLANIDGTAKVAVLGIDQVGHGTRRGASTAAPESVFFNFPNPAAARGNVLQGAADQMALVRFAKGLTLAAGTSPTGAEIRFERIAFWGHSQGATEGSIAMPYTADVAGVVFSGVGGSLIDSLLTKKSPVNLAAIAPAVLSELPSNVNNVHPVLSMFQNAIDPADPLDHAAAIVKSEAGPLAKHVFVPYGQADTYAPPATQLAYVVAARLGVAQHPASVAAPDDLLSAPVALPVSGNAGVSTVVVRQYVPNGFDGHFVVFRDADAKVNADRFLADALGGVVPSFGR
jgi:hypothetical protein